MHWSTKTKVLIVSFAIAVMLAVVILGVDFVVKDGHLIRFCFDNTPKAAVPSSREQINVYRWWINRHRSGLVVVDVGCGTGSVVDAIGRTITTGHEVKVCGFDIDESCIETACRVFPMYTFWVCDMSDFKPVSDIRPVCYILYEPLWTCSHSVAWDIYQRFFTSIVLHGESVSVVYVSGSGAFRPKPYLFDSTCLEVLGFSQVYSSTIGSLLARRYCRIFSFEQ
jgi:hypothetical protein